MTGGNGIDTANDNGSPAAVNVNPSTGTDSRGGTLTQFAALTDKPAELALADFFLV